MNEIWWVKKTVILYEAGVVRQESTGPLAMIRILDLQGNGKSLVDVKWSDLSCEAISLAVVWRNRKGARVHVGSEKLIETVQISGLQTAYNSPLL